MTETTIINVLPCRDVAGGQSSLIDDQRGILYASKPLKKFIRELCPPNPLAKDRIGQVVIVGDVLWWHGKFGTVDRLDLAMGMARLDGVDGRWAALDDAIRCPRPCQHMPQFANWTKLRDAMLVDGADIQMLGGEGVGSMHKNWIRLPDCTWRKPHLGAELKDAQSECVGY